MHEIKHDGYRLIVQREGKRRAAVHPQPHDWTDRFPRIVAAALPHQKQDCIFGYGKVRSSDLTRLPPSTVARHRPSGTAGVGADVIGVPGGNGRGGPPTTIPAGSFSTNLGFHGPEINIRAITAITTKAAIIGQLILLISQSSAQAGCWISLARSDAALIHIKGSTDPRWKSCGWPLAAFHPGGCWDCHDCCERAADRRRRIFDFNNEMLIALAQAA